jgi:hypothetical protein
MRKLGAAFALLLAGLTACGGGSSNSGTIDFGTGMNGNGSGLAVTGKGTSFPKEKIDMVAHLSEPAGAKVHVVALKQDTQNGTNTVIGATDTDSPNPSDTTIGAPFDASSGVDAGTYTIRLEHGDKVIATGTFTITG